MSKYIYHDKNIFIMTKYILIVTFFHRTDVKKKCIRIVFRKDFYGDVRFSVALRKLTKNNEKLKKLDFFFAKKKIFS